MMPRLTAEFWVQAYLTRLQLANIPAYVMARGDATAGAIIVKLATLDGQAQAFERSFDLMSDTRRWVSLVSGPEREVDEVLSRARSRDRDLWLIEIEDRLGRTLLDEPGLATD